MNFNKTNVVTGDIAYWNSGVIPSPTCLVCEPTIPHERVIIDTSAGPALIQTKDSTGWWCLFARPVRLQTLANGVELLAIFIPVEDECLHKICNSSFTESQSALELFANKPHPLDDTRNVIKKKGSE